MPALHSVRTWSLVAVLSGAVMVSCAETDRDTPANGSHMDPSTGDGSPQDDGSDGAHAGDGQGDGDGVGSGDGSGGADGADGSDGAQGTGPDASVPPPTGGQGCGNASPPASGMYNIDVGGTQRMYIVKLPANYDANTPYKLVFAWHYLGGSASGIASGWGTGGFYGLESLAGGSAIFVAPEGLDSGLGGKGWPNTGGQDVAFARAMVAKFKSDYCIDEKRIFSVGFSYGAIMSNTVGCEMGDVFRAIALGAGMGPNGACTGQVAAWLFHGEKDSTIQFSYGEASRDHWVKANHCTTPGAPDANNCVTYNGCDAGFPVVWCADANAGHTPPSFLADASWKFFSQF